MRRLTFVHRSWAVRLMDMYDQNNQILFIICLNNNNNNNDNNNNNNRFVRR